MAKPKTYEDAELIKEWSLSPAATLGSSVRAKGILLEIRARLPARRKTQLRREPVRHEGKSVCGWSFCHAHVPHGKGGSKAALRCLPQSTTRQPCRALSCFAWSRRAISRLPEAAAYAVRKIIQVDTNIELRQAIRNFRSDRVEHCETADAYFRGDGDRLRQLWTSGWTNPPVAARRV